MAKKKEIKEEIVEECVCELPKIQPIAESFGNGDLNILKDKINEIIANS